MSRRTPCVVKKSEGKRGKGEFGITREYFVVGLVAAAAGFVLSGYVMYLLTLGSFKTLPIDFTAYHAWLEQVSWLTGIAAIAFSVSAFFIIYSFKSFEPIFVVSIAIGIIIVLWVDYWRPTDAVILTSGVQYSIFCNSIAFAQILVMIVFVAGIIWKPLFKCPQ